ncbi:phage tail protein [Nitrosospira briensis]|uniref:phage tail protein n=1 Tax=Nitrosospira briensis TaxID=35799 RepID=UPI0006856AD8|nr:phage tail protein [Nitrosospira briensis]
MSGFFGGIKQKNNVTPIIASVRLQTSAYGSVVPVVFGRARVAGNLLWYGDFTPVAHTAKQSAGGKGGAGGNQKSTTYSYQAAVIIGLCEGPIIGIRTIWQGKEIHNTSDLNLSLYTGSYSQSAPPYMSTNHLDQALGYRGTAYLFSPVYQLDDQAALPNHSFEVDGLLQYGGAIVDANPKDVLFNVLTDANFGMGFSASLIGDLTQYSRFCVASGIFISPAYTQQETAHGVIERLLQLGNSNAVWSEDRFRVVPYGDAAVTGNGETYTPDLTPQYDLADDDFLDNDDPVRARRSTQADAFNQINIKFFNRANQYAEEPAEFKDQGAIEMYGLRSGNPINLDEIADPAVARTVVQLIGQRDLYQRNTYEFRLGWKYARLEPMDIVTLTDPALGLNRTPVRITEIEEDEDGALSVKAEEVLSGVSSSAVYSSQVVGGYSADYNVSPGDSNAPVIFEPPTSLSVTPQIWMATSGGVNWGSCEVWVSRDNATYSRVGLISGPARHGTGALANGSDPDVTNALVVDVTASKAVLTGGTLADRDQLNTLCLIGNELVSFQTANLTSPYHYNLTSLRRGAYGSSKAAWTAGTRFARLDQAIFKYDYDPEMIGTTIYIKLRSVNVYGLAAQDLAELTATPYAVTGSYLGTITGFALEQAFTGTGAKVKWNAYAGATSYKIEVWRAGVLKRTVSGIGSTSYEYTFEDMAADGGPWRSVDLKLYAMSGNGSSVSAATLTVTNPQIAAPAGLSATAGIGNTTIAATLPADTDYGGMLVYGSIASGFTPGTGNLLYDGPNNSETFNGLPAGVARFYRVAFYDQFGKDGLNFSSEITAIPLSAGGIIAVADLPTAGTHEGEVVYLTSDEKLHRWNGAAWVTWVDGTDILANSVTAGQMSVTNLSSISADLGTITGGTFTFDGAGHIKGGQTAYNTGTGLFLGYSGEAYKFSVGNPAGKALLWDGTNLTVQGDIIATGNISANAVTQVGTAYTLAPITGGSLQYLSVNKASDGRMLVNFSCFIKPVGLDGMSSSSSEIAIYVNGVQIYREQVIYTDTAAKNLSFYFPYVDTSSPGTKTYEIKTTSGANCQYSARSIVAMELKR